MIRRVPLRGFTLLELLIAISVLSLVSIIAWRGLDTLVATRERLVSEGDDVRALLATFGQLERDLAHVANPMLFALPGNPVNVRPTGDGPVLEILRIAPPDETGALALQRVFYRVGNSALLRQATPATRALGPIDAAQVSTVELLAGVRSLRVRLWQPDPGGWRTPMGTADAAGQPMAPPPGVEIVVERADGKTYRRVLLVG